MVQAGESIRSERQAALYHLDGSNGILRSTDLAESENQMEQGSVRSVERLGTHRGHNKLFLAVPRTPSSASASLWFVRVTFSYRPFTAVTRVQIPSGTPNLFNHLPRSVYWRITDRLGEAKKEQVKLLEQIKKIRQGITADVELPEIFLQAAKENGKNRRKIIEAALSHWAFLLSEPP